MKQEYEIITVSPRPFVKWAGGKRQLLPIISEHIPKKFDRYFEPFLGGGAVFFNLFSKEKKSKWNISDLNSDLVLSYLTIRDNVKELITSLECHAKNYSKNQSDYYYKIRASEPKNDLEKVSKLVVSQQDLF